jgi:ribonuclease P protein component
MVSVREWPPKVGAKSSMRDGQRDASASASESYLVNQVIRSLGFPRLVRLTNSKDYDRVLKRPDLRKRCGALRLAAVANTMQHARLGLIVGKRGVAKAHQRNRIKRVIRDYFRQQQQELAALDIVIQVMAEIDNAELRSLLEQILDSQIRSSKRAVKARP